jgi:purine-nucleoside/S-methyl-5'-thioadenosine phosphorylase / adenosine deaminase
VSRPRIPSCTPSKANLKAIDALYRTGGLVRSRRGTPPGITTRLRREHYAAEELTRPAPIPNVAANGVEWIAVPGWEEIDWLWHGFSTRRGGVSRAYCGYGAPGELNLGFTAADEREAVEQNRALLAEAISGSAKTPLRLVKQFHSNLVLEAKGKSGGMPCKGDGLVTAEPGVLLAVQTADCIPVLVADRKKRVVGAFHAGWRGTAQRIVENGVGRMRLRYGSKPADLVAAIGPGIGACCYSVGEEVRSEFESQFSYADELFREVFDSDPVRKKYPMLFLTQRAPGHSPTGPQLHLDLVEANRRQLLDAGLSAQAIDETGGCTQCHPELYFSHRGSSGHAGRMMSVIGIRKS